ncbi:peptidase family m13 domain-containing protein [Ditylenchus destructor]|uniref:Peptidase family m13 domain-containing protein n=1 Tax=Ditylenchus destructor TaxID=166010 RepID=A0AAD4N774_9BILA|nr:peptidase family m13 domain-containing protein [Ditylenchus destructor]
MMKCNTGYAVKLVILVVIIIILLALALLCYWNFYREYQQVLGLNASKTTNNASVDNGDAFNLELFETEKYLNLKMDVSQDPCNDFYKYACGNNDENFHEIQKVERNPEEILQRALAIEKDIHKHLSSVRNAQLFFNKCVRAHNGSDNSGTTEFLTKTIRRFEEYTGIKFPSFHAAQTSFAYPTPEQLGKAFGHLLGTHFMRTYLPFDIQVAENIREDANDPVNVIKLTSSIVCDIEVNPILQYEEDIMRSTTCSII